MSVDAEAGANSIAEPQHSIRSVRLNGCRRLRLLDGDFAYKRLPIGQKAPVVGGEAGQVGQLHALHRRFDPAEGMATDQNLVRGKDQAELLLHVPGVAFAENELVEGKQ